MKKFFSELKRRNVYKVAIAYAVVAWLLMQIASQIFPFFASETPLKRAPTAHSEPSCVMIPEVPASIGPNSGVGSATPTTKSKELASSRFTSF